MSQKGSFHSYAIRTPSRKKVISSITRKSFHASAAAMLRSPRFMKSIAIKLALKIRGEMKRLSSTTHNSILRDSNEAVRQFHWETVRLELHRNVPTLMNILSLLVGPSEKHYPLLCLLGSMILKARHQHLCLVQRVVSIMLYGNGTAKQVIILLTGRKVL